MKTIGLIGGMSWESTALYYREINELVKQRLGGLHSARVLLYSVDFAEIESLQHAGEWEKTASILAAAARSLESGGADFFLICTNTMHKVAKPVQEAVNIPLLHIADATAQALKEQGISRVGLLGTRFTMEQDFYKGRLQQQFGIDVLVPDIGGRDTIHRVIYDELCLGQINESSRQAYLAIVNQLQEQGAEAVILGCTEIGMLIGDCASGVPFFDTTAIHASRAVDRALGETGSNN